MILLVRCFSYNPDDTFSNLFLIVTHVMLVLVRRFSYIPRAGLLRNFFYTPDTSFSEEFPLHS